MRPFTILCPTDFSECSLNAIEYASRLGEHYQAVLVLFHVPNREDYKKLTSPGESADMHRFATTKLNSLSETVKAESLKNGLKDCQTVIVEGKTVQTILEFADTHAVDLIVMGTEGVNDFKQNYIGTKTSKVVEQAGQDVFIIPRKVYFKHPRKLVFATDYMEEDKLAIQKVVEMARFFDSEVDIVHVGTKIRTIDKALHQTMINEISPFIKYEKTNFILKAYRDDPGLGLESYLISAKGDVLFTLSKKKSWFESLFTKNLSRKMSYFINKPLYVIKTV
ncbi:MAG: universal stress protein [Lunatimonas sp.]|uniref:universal stress protein n=1 Tax=Lunatimonas sp. TaxID=2060141 RepID=UPI00263AD7A6|nr:universal stress protein [Lunatimonas sp.]MCC5936660.1 universal stress protein [Lunatimonas sp.]